VIRAGKGIAGHAGSSYSLTGSAIMLAQPERITTQVAHQRGGHPDAHSAIHTKCLIQAEQCVLEFRHIFNISVEVLDV
jgi:hypothetical protein